MTSSTSDADRLEQYVDAWKSAVDDTVALLRSLDAADWARPTDLAGWDVKAVAAHLAHLESELAGNEQLHVEVAEAPHIVSPMGFYTEMGPLARREWPTDRIVDELERSAADRFEELRADSPSDGTAAPTRTPGGIGWDWNTLLSNRVVDVWMHEQDIRRAVGRPGNLDTAAAAHTVRVFANAFGYAVGKRVAPPPGTTVVLDVRGAHPVHLAVEVNEAGRAVTVPDDPDSPTVRLEMGTETFAILGGGRRSPDRLEVRMVGDEDLGRRVLAAMAVTP